ncbi:MAG: DEAD/DEAH box helicase family protein [Clostridiales bacterium]|nr:DEAD/DEAH box helicase family protein [Clostridiales bacterium]
MTILSKKQMSEEDIKLNYITPAILSGWKGHITMETKITDGRIKIKGNMVVRSKPKFADYLLYLNDGKPIAVVEAKDNNHSVSYGLQQAMTYAMMMDLPFAYSSNGDGFYEHDFLTGKERKIGLNDFPTQDELIQRYCNELSDKDTILSAEQKCYENDQFSDEKSLVKEFYAGIRTSEYAMTEERKQVIQQAYYMSQNTYLPRYYQRNAINRTVEAIANGRQRLLLVMATGTGKTYTAFQIVYRLLRSGIKNRILYLADRNILVDQSILQDFAPLEKTIYKVDFSNKECLNNIGSHEVNFALYHQMIGQNDEEHFRQIPSGYFDLIIVDVVLCQEKVQVKHELFTSIFGLMPHLFPCVLILSNISFHTH